jgi:hypothetical protein
MARSIAQKQYEDENRLMKKEIERRAGRTTDELYEERE